MIMKFYSFLVLFIFSSTFLLGQNQRMSYADKQFNSLHYYFATEAYEDVLERTGDSLSLVPNIAIGYDKIGNAEKAVAWYDFMYRNDVLDSLGLLRLGLMQRRLNNYDESLRLLKEHVDKYGSNDITEGILENADLLSDLQLGDGNFSVRELSMNTSSSEMAVAYYKEGEVIVTSAQRDFLPVNRVYGWTGDHYYNLYKGSVSEDGEVGKLKQLRGSVRTKFHESYLSYDVKNNLVYFTRNNYLGKAGFDDDKGMRLKIYKARVKGDKFVDVEELPFNSASYSCGHPTVSSDGSKLYFVSDMPGGYGGSDIYSVDIYPNGEYGEPKNLGEKVNTSNNEVTPFYHSKDNVLFFSSDGHMGLGGYDVFVAKLSKEGEVKGIENLGSPINSSSDDISFINNEDQSMGYISSNRSNGIDNIFSFSQTTAIRSNKVVEGYVFDLLTLDTLEGVDIFLTNGEGIVLGSVQSDSLGVYSLDLPDDYQGVFYITTESTDTYTAFHQASELSSSEYFSKIDVGLSPLNKLFLTGIVNNAETGDVIDRARVSIIDVDTGDTIQEVFTNSDGHFVIDDIISEDIITLDIVIDKVGFHDREERVRKDFGSASNIDLDLSLHPSTDLVEVLSLNPIYFSLNGWDIRNESKVELDKVVKWLIEHPNESIEVRSHTDAQGTHQYNDWLSEQRAKATVDYIISKGISRDRVSGKGYGERRLKISSEEISKLKTQKEKDAMHQLNRRSEFIVVEK